MTLLVRGGKKRPSEAAAVPFVERDFSVAWLPRTRPPGHYYIGLLQFSLLLLKNHSLFSQNRYAHEQAAILRGTFSSLLSGEGFDEVGRGELPLVLRVTP